MGYGFPASIGTSRCSRCTCYSSGRDGSFQMNYKIATIKNLCLLNFNLKQQLFRNGKAMARAFMIKDMLLLVFLAMPIAHECDGKNAKNIEPDFVKLAYAYGIKAFRIKKPQDIETTLKEALLEEKGPVLIDVIISREENVMPMVPAGHSINSIIQKYQ